VSATCSGESSQAGSTHLISPVLKTTIDLPFSIAPQMTWDGFQRLAYDKLGAGLREQAIKLVKRGNITYQEMENLVNAGGPGCHFLRRSLGFANQRLDPPGRCPG
jgi:hypothetical protein